MRNELVPLTDKRVQASGVLTDQRRGDLTLVCDVQIEGENIPVIDHLWLNLPPVALLIESNTRIRFEGYVSLYRRINGSQDMHILPTRLLD